jgi:hypothetical protein
MFEVSQDVTVITYKGIAYDGYIQARAKGDDGQGAYRIGLYGSGPEQLGQWHKASDIFVQEKIANNAKQA